jgi:hypothetical protein
VAADRVRIADDNWRNKAMTAYLVLDVSILDLPGFLP